MKISKDKKSKITKGENVEDNKNKLLRHKIRTLEKQISKCEDQIKVLRIKLQRGIQDLSS
ncbi:MAG: hypothetical protein HZB59_02340 [Ignavibacteriales bacterium]|nr:hypothetical protein [Ignavibacteriales bacterium]